MLLSLGMAFRINPTPLPLPLLTREPLALARLIPT
jgi:hypothetical protein